jgi:hypothetical protein
MVETLKLATYIYAQNVMNIYVFLDVYLVIKLQKDDHLNMKTKEMSKTR